MGGHRVDRDFEVTEDLLFVPLGSEVNIRLERLPDVPISEELQAYQESDDVEIDIVIEDEVVEGSKETEDFTVHTRPTKEYPCAAARYWLIKKSKTEEPPVEGGR